MEGALFSGVALLGAITATGDQVAEASHVMIHPSRLARSLEACWIAAVTLLPEEDLLRRPAE
jgi:hypothetical protein